MRRLSICLGLLLWSIYVCSGSSLSLSIMRLMRMMSDNVSIEAICLMCHLCIDDEIKITYFLHDKADLIVTSSDMIENGFTLFAHFVISVM